ncbi:MAG: MBL fold metallo-hydrolase [Gammaproteobacteria bacterium]|nr:MBL fold metallo-hydrolase [Gammaproteobacteria bacterium]|tara:strand:- start:634 stop:1542 length:909 start_codon:yes stop_codon:yes gene_type:complete
MFDHAAPICNAGALFDFAGVVRVLKWQVGDVRITQVVELTTASLGPHLLPQATPAAMQSIPWMAPFIDERGRIVLSMHALVVESLGQTIVVDTCIGNDKSRTYPKWNNMQGDFLQRFSAAGFSTQQVDTVLCTHMHVDHVGWNTRWQDGAWLPTFPRAEYLFAEDEWQYWREQSQEYGPVIEDSVQPIFDSGQAVLVSQQHRLNEEIFLLPTPGHTPGHVSVHIQSKGEAAIITGDMLHHPCQIVHPDWSTTADTDQSMAAATRTAFLRQYSDQPVLVIGTHFAAPTAGHIVRDGVAYRLSY